MQVTLFTKENCQLCDAIKYELLDLQAEYEFEMNEVFVDSESEAPAVAKERVPHVQIELEGRVISHFAFPVNQVELRRAIRNEMMKRSERQG
ncbi:MAG: glutaredoxin family protein [Caldilineaceae bacterium]|nr:glutaredoxin family protein [Caldilineaceae bacterium]MDE0312902.1 glutaredoxin family protein [Caldilineaceae bacterium]